MDLIKIEVREIGVGRQVDAVSARELWRLLESKQDFSDWVKNRINQCNFIENEDFLVFHNSMENPQGGRPLTEFIFTVEAAKHLAMIERTEKGKEIEATLSHLGRAIAGIAQRGNALPLCRGIPNGSTAATLPTVGRFNRVGSLSISHYKRVIGQPRSRLHH